MSKNLKINVLSSVAQVILSIGLMILLYHQIVVNLGIERLGVWSIILSSTAFFNLSTLGFTGGITPFVSSYHSHNKLHRVVQTIQTACCATTIVVTLLSILVYPLIREVLPIFIDTKYLIEAQTLLPLAIISFWFNSIAGIFLSGLDGLHKMYVRSAISSTASVLYSILALVLVRFWGLQGMAYAQIAQSVLLMISSAYMLRKELPSWSPFLFKIEPSTFRELFSYGLNFQVMSLAQVVSDPLTKLLIAKFGSLQSVAFYEMSIKIVGVFRNILASANQAIVPTVATESAETISNIEALYQQNLRIIRSLSLLIYPAFICFSWLISEGWLGIVEPQFVLCLTFIALGYGFNTMSLPVHFVNLGIRQLRWNVIATVASAVTMAMAGGALGWMFGAMGVVAAWALSALVGTVVLVGGFQQRYSVSALLYLDNNEYKLVFSNVLTLFFCWFCYYVDFDWSFGVKAFFCCLVYGTLTAFALWHNLVFRYFQNIVIDFIRGFRSSK